MKGYRFAGCALIATVVAIATLAAYQAPQAPVLSKTSRDYPVKPVPFTAVHVTDTFWAPRLEINRRVTIPFAMGKNEETGRVNNFRRAAQVLQGPSAAGRVHSRRQALVAIPYYGWANRGPGEMTVWIANAEKAIRPQPAPTVASESRVTTSSGRGVRAVNDLASPASSYDGSEGYFHWWPHKGTTEWVEYAFATATRISRASLYWYDDTGHGECRIPARWRVLYRDGDTCGGRSMLRRTRSRRIGQTRLDSRR
jgi:Glycoside hydrolase family 127 C-terminal domain